MVIEIVEPTSEQISDLRNSFLKELETKGEDTIHPSDLKKIKNEDDWLRRFLLHHDNDQKMALQMIWNTVVWRKEVKANEISTSNIRMEYILDGGFFAHNRDKDGCAMFIFKCKKHCKGTRDMGDVKKCVIYWLERLEKEENGKPITLFFDLDGCGLSNMDLDFTKYLIVIMKDYYPYFLNYIIVFEMAWVLNAAFKIIKSWLPEKARQKIKMLKKSDLKEYVPIDQQLSCWGGTDDYVFTFEESKTFGTPGGTPLNNNSSNKKVHFADGSPMSVANDSNVASGDKENETSALIVRPPSVIIFNKEGSELVSSLDLQNNDPTAYITYKMKTTSPEKFRVRPSMGFLHPGGRTTIHVNLLPGYQLGSMSKDKFLVMSMQVESTEMTPQELTDLWKNTTGKNITQHRLSCTQVEELTKNGNAITVGGLNSEEQGQLKKLKASIVELSDSQGKLQSSVKTLLMLQVFTLVVVIVLGVAIIFDIRSEFRETESVLSNIRERDAL